MLTLPDSQADYSNRASMVTIPLVTFTTYSNYGAGASTTWYWSTVPVHYDWEGLGDQYFRDVIVSISNIDLVMPHLTVGLVNQIGTPTLSLTLANDEINGEYLWRDLRTTNLTNFATVEYAELLVNPDRMMVQGSTAWWDLRDLAGTEHTYRFRGELIDCEITEDVNTFGMFFKTIVPEVPVVQLLSQTENDPKDFGTILPIVYGEAKRVPCKNILTGWTTTLAEPLSKNQTGVVRVTDATHFPAASTFDIVAGKEIIRCSASDHTGHTVTITTRGYSNSRKVIHLTGEIILELLDEIIIGLAGHSCKEIQVLYLRSPYTGELIRCTSPATLYPEDTNAVSGSTISTARMSQESLLGFLLSANVNPEVTVQPVQAVSGEEATSDHAHPTDQTEEDTGSGSRGYWADVDTETPQWQFNPGYSRKRLKCEWTGSLDSSNYVKRWRINVTANISTTPEDMAGVKVFPHDIPGNCFGGLEINCTSPNSGNVSRDSGWQEPDTDVTPSQLVSENSYLNVYGYNNQYPPYPAVHITLLNIEWEVSTSTPTVTRDVDVEIEAASLGMGLDFYADIDGYTVPYSFSEGYDYEDNESWAETNCTSARDDAAGPPEGSYYRSVTSTTTGAVATQITGLTSDKDLSTTDDRYRISMYCIDTSDIDMTIPIKVWFSDTSTGASGTSPPTERMEFQVDPALLVDITWVDIEVTAFDITGNGTVDPSDIDTIGMSYTADGSGTTAIYFDDLAVAAATNANYDDAPGTLIDKMPDIARHFIADHCELGHSAIDDTSFDDALDTGRLDTNVYAGAVTRYGYTFEAIIAGLAFEGRGNIVREEASTGSIYKYHAAQYTSDLYRYTAPARTLDEWNGLSERLRTSDQIATRFRSFWGHDPSLGFGAEAFTQLSRADTTVNDTLVSDAKFTVSVLRLGQRDALPLPLYLVQDETTSEDILGWYAHEGMGYDQSVWSLVVPFWLGFDLQRGDIVQLTPPWSASAQKARVLGVSRQFGAPAIRLTLGEVLTA